MTIKELIKEFEGCDENEQVWGIVKLKGRIMPEEVIFPIKKTDLTSDGFLLS